MKNIFETTQSQIERTVKTFQIEKNGRHNGKNVYGIRNLKTGDLIITTYSATGAKMICEILEANPTLSAREAYLQALENC